MRVRIAPARRLLAVAGLLVSLLAALLVGTVATAGPASAATVAFRTPSGNVSCLYVSSERVGLRCDIVETRTTPRRPASCQLDYGHAFGLTRAGRALRLCVGDFVGDPQSRLLGYGKTLRLGPYTCASTRKQLRCVNRARHGFALSRAAQRVF